MVGSIYITVIFAFYSHLLKQRLLRSNCDITSAGDSWKQHPILSLCIIIKNILLTWSVCHIYYCAAMRHTCSNTDKHRKMDTFRKVISLRHQVVHLLLTARFEYRYHCKFSIEATILFILRRMHRSVTGNKNNNTAISTSDCRIDKRISAHIKTNMLHTYQSTFSHVRHT